MEYARAMSEHVAKREPEMNLLPLFCDPSMISVDVGASWGAYTYRLAALSRLCYAFEPNPKQSAFLQECFGSNVCVVAQAVSERSGTAVLREPADIREHATIEQENDLQGRPTIQHEVKCSALDSLDLRGVAFVKIDVEGHEPSVLRGMSEMLDRETPFLFVEVADKHNPQSRQWILAWMAQKGYEAFIHRGGLLRRLCASSVGEEQAAGWPASGLIIFCHRSRMGRVPSNFFAHQEYGRQATGRTNG